MTVSPLRCVLVANRGEIAQRVLRMGGVEYAEELLEFVLTKVISNGSTAHFEGAQQLIRLYRERHSGATELSQRINWLEFNLAIEQGAAEDARKLYESGIRSDAEGRLLSPAELLLCVRYCFLDFMHADNAAHGKELNEAVLLDPETSASEVLRAEFYRIKLIPNRAKILDPAAENRAQVHQVLDTYERLISSVKGLVQEQEQDRKSRDLLKEILNDCMGYHADTLWGAKDQMPLFGLDFEKSRRSFEEWRRLRLRLENEIDEGNWLDPSWVRRGTDIDYRGLCYTYNYVQRAYANLGMPEDSIRVGHMSFLLNSFIADKVSPRMPPVGPKLVLGGTKCGLCDSPPVVSGQRNEIACTSLCVEGGFQLVQAAQRCHFTPVFGETF